MVKLVDNVKFNTPSTGTGDLTFGSAIAGFIAPGDSALEDGDTVRYRIVEVIEGVLCFEQGVGTIADSVSKMERTTVDQSYDGSSVGTSKLDLGGTAIVGFTVSAVDIVNPADPAALDKLGGTTVGKALFTATNADGARAALELDIVRQNILLDRIYQAKAFGHPRRVINAFADGYVSSSGINSGSSSGYDVVALSGYVHPSGNNTAQISAPASTAGAQGFTLIDRSTAVPNGTVVKSVGVYSTVARTIKAKIALRNSANNYTVVVDQSYSHGGSGWEDVTLSAPYTVPGAGTYYLAAYVGAGGSSPNVTASVARAYLNSDLIGTGATTAEDTNTVFPLRYTTQLDNMTLVTASQTVDAPIDHVRAIVEYFCASPVTFGDDYTVEVTCDSGSNWTLAPVAVLTENGQTMRIPTESEDIACAPGTSFAARLKTLTNKDILFTGLSLVTH